MTSQKQSKKGLQIALIILITRYFYYQSQILLIFLNLRGRKRSCHEVLLLLYFYHISHVRSGLPYEHRFSLLHITKLLFYQNMFPLLCGDLQLSWQIISAIAYVHNISRYLAIYIYKVQYLSNAYICMYFHIHSMY